MQARPRVRPGKASRGSFAGRHVRSFCRAARATTTPILEAMTEQDWAREGWHTEGGRYTPENWLEIYAVHAHNHAAQIARLKKALSA